jgi:hypothetical protein
MGRNTQGVKLIKLDKNDFIADIAKVVREEDDRSLPEDNGIKEDKDYSENNDANYEE